MLEKKNFGCRVFWILLRFLVMWRARLLCLCACAVDIDIADLDENSQRILPTENMSRLNTEYTEYVRVAYLQLAALLPLKSYETYFENQPLLFF